jgi:hypothetical protein
MPSSVGPSSPAAEPRFLSVVRRSVGLSGRSLRSFLSFLFLLSSLLVLAGPAPAQPAPAQPASAQPPASITTVERVVAVVDGRPLLLSDLRALERVRGLAEEPALRELVDEQLMYFEAARLPQAELRGEEEQSAVDEMLSRRPDLLGAVPLPDLHRIARRQGTILKYVEFRFRPQLRVSDDEVRAAFAADPAAGDSYEAAKERIRGALERKALDERVEAWVRELRLRADVRYVGRAAPAAEP